MSVPTMSVEIVIQHMAGSSLTGEIQRFHKPTVKLGRNSDNDVIFDFNKDRVVSANHAELYLEQGNLFVRDLASRNGTFVNGEQITDPIEIGPSDRVQLGENGPEIVAELYDQATEGLRTRTPSSGSRPKRFIGEQTLQNVIDTVVEKERSRTRRHFTATIVGLALAGLVGVGAIWLLTERKVVGVQADREETRKQIDSIRTEVADSLREFRQKMSDDIAQRVAASEEELKSLRGKLTESEIKHSQLTAQISEREKEIWRINRSGGISAAEREKLVAELKQSVAELGAELRQNSASMRQTTDAGDWSGVVTRFRESLFLCAARDPKSEQFPGIGTAFVIRKDGLLATNAHVVELLEQRPERFVVQNETGRRFNVLKLKARPDTGDRFLGPDVGLIMVDTGGVELTPIDLASDEEIKGLQIGMHLGTLGFPGELLEHYFDGFDPATNRYKTTVATFKDGWIGRITDFNFAPANADESRIIQHSASLSGGTSGSPMFTQAGKVVALNFGIRRISYDVSKSVGGRTEVVRGVAPDPSEISYAIRVDVLRDFLKETGW